jgi:hypothetical protein
VGRETSKQNPTADTAPLSMHKPQSPRRFTTKENRWTFFNNGCVRGVHHSEIVIVKSRPRQSLAVDRVGVFTISRAVAVIAALALATLLALLLSACAIPRSQRGGQATTSFARPGRTNLATLSQPENPKDPSRQKLRSEQTVEYILPTGTTLSIGDATPAQAALPRAGRSHAASSPPESAPEPDAPSAGINPFSAAPTAVAVLGKPMPVRISAIDQAETTIGAAQKDLAREWAAKAATLQPVMWAGIAMMTLVAGLLAYFGWWTKAGLAVAIGVGMIVLAQTLPAHGTFILFGGVAVFALAALLILYSYYKGQLDQNHNGIPDFLERAAPKSQG